MTKENTGVTLVGSTRKTFLPGVVDVDIPTEQAAQSATVDLSWGEDQRMPPFSLHMTAGRGNGALRVRGLRLAALLDVARRFPKSGKTDGRPKKRGAEAPATVEALIDALPLFDDASVSVTHTDVSFVTGVATVLAKTFEIDVGGTGIVHRGSLHFRMTAREMKVASVLIPAWAVPLLPSEATLQARVSGFDFASVTTYALGHAAGKGSAAAADAKQRRELYLPNGKAEVDFTGTRFAGDGWSLAVEARLDIDDTGMKGNLAMRFRGLDGLVERVRAASASDPRATAMAQELEGLMARAGKVGDEWIVHDTVDQPKKSSASGSTPAKPAPAPSPAPAAP